MFKIRVFKVSIRLIKKYLLSCLIVGIATPAFSVPESSFSKGTYKVPKSDDINKSVLASKIGDMYLQLGGRVKLDAFYDVNGRQFGTYGVDVAALPLDGIDFNAQRRGNFNATLTGTRLNIDAYKVLGKTKSHVFVEFDFNGNSSTTTNSYSPRLRFAFGEVMDETERHILLVGQGWTNFGNIEAAPRTLNNVPASFRVAQIRYTHMIMPRLSVAAALEKPSVQYFQNTGVVGTSGYQDNDSTSSNSKPSTPDLTMQIRFKNDVGQLSLAGVARKLQVKAVKGVNGALDNFNQSKLGWGVGIAGVLEVLKPVRLMGQIIGGKGTGRYIDDLGNQNPLDSYFQYRTADNLGLTNHYENVKAMYYNAGIMVNWTKCLNSTMGGAYTKVFTPEKMTAIPATTRIFHKSMQRYHVNLIYTIFPNNEVGFEVEHFKRKAGVPVEFNGRDTRFVVSYIYNF